MRLAATIALLLLPTLSGCVIGSEKWPRPRDLSPAWLVDKTRILAVRADPPEIAPGESATFEALVPQPGVEDEWLRIWFACPPEDPGGIGFGCVLDFDATGTGTDLPDGMIGFEPGLSPFYMAEADLLDGIKDERELAEGLHVLVQIASIPLELLESADGQFDFNEVEIGYKRLVVSEATTPNKNPVIFEFVVERLSIPHGSIVHVEAKQTYEIGTIIAENSIEDYEYLNRDGVIENRKEEPYVSWYSTGGTILEEYTLYPYPESTWTAPDKSGEAGVWYAVVRDRRGGMDWYEQAWVVD
jgi:hypothetical protein